MIPLYQTYKPGKQCHASNTFPFQSKWTNTLEFNQTEFNLKTLEIATKLQVLTMWFCFRYDFKEDNNALRWCSLEEGHLFLSSRLGQAITNTSWSGRHKYKLVKTGAKYSGDGRFVTVFTKAFTFNLCSGINSLLSLLFRVTEMTGWQWAVSNFTRT